MENFPPNSITKSPAPQPEEGRGDKKVEKLEGVVVTRRKEPLGKKFARTFLGDEPKGVFAYILMEVLLPAAKDMVVDAATQGIERAIFGDSRPSSRRIGRTPGQTYVSYDRFAQGRRREEPRRESARAGRTNPSRPRFDEILVASRVEGEEIISRLRDMIARYQNASIADLYAIIDISGNYIDDKWGWTDLTHASVSYVSHNEYVLNLPQPIPLD